MSGPSLAPMSRLAGQYQIVRQLGSGGMGEVFLARDLALHRSVAVKVLRPAFAVLPDAAELFRREARLGARLHHPGIVTIYGFGEADGAPYLVMQYLSGGSLGERIREGGAMTPSTVRRLLADLAAALAYAHGEGVVHRDIKPDNIFLTGPEDAPHPVLGDFGVAMRPMHDLGPGERRLRFGTPHFMSPEQSAGELDLDGRSDLFALGVLGYLMLTGVFPYDGPSESAIAAARAREARVPLREAAPLAPPDLVAAIERCLATRAADRWPKAAALEEALRAGEAAAHAPPRLLWGRLTPGRRTATPTPVSRRRGRLAVTSLASVPAARPRRSDSIRGAAWTGFRRAVRSLRQTPAVTLAALLCLGLGLGATTAIFSAVNAALLRRLPFRSPERLVSVFRTTPNFRYGPFSPATWLDLRANTRSLEQLAAIAPNVGLLEGPEGALRVDVYRASGNLFPMLGVTAVRGRMLRDQDERPEEPAVVLVSEELWRSRYGADPSLVGRVIRVNGDPRTVVGIAPRGLRIPSGTQSLRSDLWVPLRFEPDEAALRRSNFMFLIGALRDGFTPVAADGELHAVMQGISEAHPELRGESIQALPLHRESVRTVRGPLLLLLGAVGFVLLIAAANVASLLLARGAERRREVAIRAALGASRASILRGVLGESLVLAGGGVLLGLGLAWAGVRGIGTLAAARMPQLTGLSVDHRMMGFAIALAVVVALACGIGPAWRTSRADPQDALRSGGARTGAGTAHHRFLHGLILSEVALAVVLLLGAGLVMRGFVRLVRQDPGFDPKPLLTMVVSLPNERYRNAATTDAFLTPALEAIRAVPGVADAGAINLLPYDNWGWNWNVHYEGRPAGDPTRYPLVENRVVSPSLFRTLGMRLLEGRLLTDADDGRPNVPAVVVVNHALAARDFPGGDPVGKRFYTGDTTFATIVGVVADIRNVGPFNSPDPEMYWSYAQNNTGAVTFPLVVRVSGGDPRAAIAPVQAAIRGVEPAAAVSRVRSLEEIISTSVGQPRFYLVLLSIFAAVALLLSVAGLYGLTTYAVARRTREIGIRAALGATPAQTTALVLREGMLLVGGGLAAGALLAAGITRLLTRMLYGVSPLDPLAWGAVGVVLILVGVVATLLPARRAARVDPLAAIRAE